MHCQRTDPRERTCEIGLVRVNFALHAASAALLLAVPAQVWAQEYTVTDISAVAGPVSPGNADAINASGQVTGVGSLAGTGSAQSGYLYSNGTITNLGYLAPSNPSTYPYAINASGQVTGASRYSTTDTDFDGHAFLYSNGQMTDLGALAGTTSIGYGINDQGQVTGESGTGAFL